jgi:hypothetical protein
LSYNANAFGFDETDGESPEPGYVFWSITCSYAVAVFVVVPIDYVMATVFDTPVAAIGCKYAFWIGLVGCSACDAKCSFVGIFAVFLVRSLSLNHKSLANVRKVKIVVEFVCNPYFNAGAEKLKRATH